MVDVQASSCFNYELIIYVDSLHIMQCLTYLFIHKYYLLIKKTYTLMYAKQKRVTKLV